MDTVEQIKNRLLEIRDNAWKITEGTDIYGLALECMDNIGSIDPVLRDELILEMLFHMITEKLLTREQVRELLGRSLNEKHLFCGLGGVDDDSVFNRAFTILVVRAAIYYHNSYGNDLLSKEEMLEVFGRVIEYVRLEKDTRGYITGKGWAHAIAHSGDALRTLALCSCIQNEQGMAILEVIKEKANLSDSVYINEESERLVSAAVNVIERGILSEAEITGWIRSFGELETPSLFPALHYWRENVKDLLRSLYFRLKFRKAPVVFLDEIEEVLNSISSVFNSLKQ